MKRRSGAPDAETDLKIVLDFNSDGPSNINNKTLTKDRIKKLRQTLSPHLAVAFLSKFGAKRAREADRQTQTTGPTDRAIAAQFLQQDSPTTRLGNRTHTTQKYNILPQSTTGDFARRA